MATLLQAPKRRGQDLVERGVAKGGADFISALLDRQRLNRLGKERAEFEQALIGMESKDEALGALAAINPEVRETFGAELDAQIDARFPKEETIDAIRADTGEIERIAFNPDFPPTTETLRARGLETGEQGVVIITGEDGRIRFGDSALGRSALDRDLTRVQAELLPGETASIAIGPEIATFEGIRGAQIQRRGLELEQARLDEEKRQFELSGSDWGVFATATNGTGLEALRFAESEEEANQIAQQMQELFPDKTIIPAPRGQIDDYFASVDDQIQRRTNAIRARSSEGQLSVAQQELDALVATTMANDPMATRTGVTSLSGQQARVDSAFELFNGRFDGNVFSLDSKENAALVRNGRQITSTLMTRELDFQQAMDVSFNFQIMGSVLPDLLQNREPNSALAQEATKRLNLSSAEVKAAGILINTGTQQVNMREYDPKANGPIFNLPIDDPTTGTRMILPVILVNGEIVPFGRAIPGVTP